MPKSRYPRVLAELASYQWAITDEAMEGLKRAVQEGLTFEDRDLFHGATEEQYTAVSSLLGPRAEETLFTRVKGSVGSLFVAGPLVPRASAFLESSGVVSYDRLVSEFRALEADPRISDILFVFDSPGGAVTGVAELAAVIADCDKRVTAYVTGMAASAAYWLASAADQVVAAPTGLTGSIGVISTSSIDKDDSVVTIRSEQSPKKRLDAASEEGQAVLQERVNDLAEVFIDAVAGYRKVSRDTVINKFGEGGVVVASKALAAGMIDKIETLDKLIDGLNAAPAQRNQAAALTAAAKEAQAMTLKELLAEHPELSAEVEALKSAAWNSGAEKAKEQVEARVKGAAKYLANENYPAIISAMALEAIQGTTSLDALVGAVAMYDAIAASKVSLAAQADTVAQPVVAAVTVPELSNDGQIRTGADLDKEIAELRGEV